MTTEIIIGNLFFWGSHVRPAAHSRCYEIHTTGCCCCSCCSILPTLFFLYYFSLLLAKKIERKKLITRGFWLMFSSLTFHSGRFALPWRYQQLGAQQPGKNQSPLWKNCLPICCTYTHFPLLYFERERERRSAVVQQYIGEAGSWSCFFYFKRKKAKKMKSVCNHLEETTHFRMCFRPNWFASRHCYRYLSNDASTFRDSLFLLFGWPLARWRLLAVPEGIQRNIFEKMKQKKKGEFMLGEWMMGRQHWTTPSSHWKGNKYKIPKQFLAAFFIVIYFGAHVQQQLSVQFGFSLLLIPFVFKKN